MTILWNSSLLTRLVLFLPLSPCFCCFVWSVQVRLIANNSYASLIFELNYSWQYLKQHFYNCFQWNSSEILHEAEELWQRQSGSDASSEVGSISSGSLSDGGCMTVQEMALPSPRYVHTPSNTGRNIAMLPPSALAAQHGNILLDPNL